MLVAVVILLFVAVYPFVVGFSFPTAKIPKAFQVTAIENNKEMEMCEILEGDKQHQLISEILLNNSDGWKVDINTYIPTLKIHSESMSILISNTWTVNFEHDSLGWVQLSKTIKADISVDYLCR